MSYKVEVTDSFRKQAKRLVKKYPSLRHEIEQLIYSLEKDPMQGTAMGNQCYKIRLGIASKGKGKSGGARVISHCWVSGKKVFLLSIYDKSERADITDSELAALMEGLL